jgi:hypothetical protein
MLVYSFGETMLKSEYHERIEQGMWRRARDKRISASWRLHLRFQAGRFRALARMAREIGGKDEITDEWIRNLARQWRCSLADARKVVMEQNASAKEARIAMPTLTPPKKPGPGPSSATVKPFPTSKAMLSRQAENAQRARDREEIESFDKAWAKVRGK